MRILSPSVAAAAFLFASAHVLAGQTSAAALVAVGDSLRFTSVTAGGSHSCGLTAEGRAYCWGRNDVGQLGDSTLTDRPTPVLVSGGVAFQLLSAGDHHTCAISTDYEPYCWGGNESGQLGNGALLSTNYPFKIGRDLQFTLIAAGKKHTCATLKHWDKQDRMLCWGSNSHGQLGTMSPKDASTPQETFGVIRYVSVALGDLHSCGATKQGKVFCWGANSQGQVGNGSATASFVPFLTRMNRRVTFTSVAAGRAHICGLTSENEVFCWGDNGAGQIGNGKVGGRVLSPTALRDALGFTAISAGGDLTCGLRKDGTASCWGSNATGVLGAVDAAGSRVPAPALPGTNLAAISLGPMHGCAVRPDGTALCWGAGTVKE